MAFLIWTASTAAFWFLLNVAANTIEAAVPQYRLRLLAMVVAGAGIGALAAMVGYAFGLIALLFLGQAYVVARKVRHTLDSLGLRPTAKRLSKYMLPAVLLGLAATVCSYLFQLEVCSPGMDRCSRVFFELMYTPPHLR